MALLGFWLACVLPALVLLLDPNVVVHDFWDEVGGGILSGSLLQPSFQLWNLIDTGSRSAIKLMNSSWSGPAETNIYHKGDSMYLQVSTSVGAGQELYIQSCYATLSPNPMDKVRSALILNKGCVSSKHLMIKFISKKQDSINLLLDTSRLKLSRVYIHCSMVFSSVLTLDTKSCNYNKNKSIWIELGGETRVCKCCASKCKGPPFYGGLNKLRTLVSTGPLFIKEKLEEEPMSYSFNATFQNGSTPEENLNSFGLVPSAIQKGLSVAGLTISSNSQKIPDGAPWPSQPVASDSMIVGQDPGSALMLLTGHLVDVAPETVIKIVIDLPDEIGTADLGILSKDGVPVENVNSEDSSKATSDTRDLTSLTPELLDDYMSDSTGLKWDLGDVDGFPALEEELRGDMFISHKWPQHSHHAPTEKVHKDAVTSPVVKLQEHDGTMILGQIEKVVKKVKGNELGKLKYIKRSKLMFNQALNGSRSLSYEEEERSPSVGEQEVTKNKLVLEWTKVEEQSKTPEQQLVQSLLDLVRGLNETMTDQ